MSMAIERLRVNIIRPCKNGELWGADARYARPTGTELPPMDCAAPHAVGPARRLRHLPETIDTTSRWKRPREEAFWAGASPSIVPAAGIRVALGCSHHAERDPRFLGIAPVRAFEACAGASLFVSSGECTCAQSRTIPKPFSKFIASGSEKRALSTRFSTGLKTFSV